MPAVLYSELAACYYNKQLRVLALTRKCVPDLFGHTSITVGLLGPSPAHVAPSYITFIMYIQPFLPIRLGGRRGEARIESQREGADRSTSRAATTMRPSPLC